MILHGSNMNSRSYVGTIAAAWPDIARDYILLGINGETPSDLGDEPRFNYTYVNYVGRSTFKGFPGTDRESPALVNEAMAELKGRLPDLPLFRGRTFPGGIPDLQPADELPRVDRRCVPDLVRRDLPVRAGRLCRRGIAQERSGRSRWRSSMARPTRSSASPWVNMRRLSSVRRAGPHSVSSPTTPAATCSRRLPVGPAIRWLEAQTSRDPATLLDFAATRLKQQGYRDAIAALHRARSLSLDDKPEAPRR